MIKLQVRISSMLCVAESLCVLILITGNSPIILFDSAVAFDLNDSLNRFVDSVLPIETESVSGTHSFWIANDFCFNIIGSKYMN